MTYSVIYEGLRSLEAHCLRFVVPVLCRFGLCGLRTKMRAVA